MSYCHLLQDNLGNCDKNRNRREENRDNSLCFITKSGQSTLLETKAERTTKDSIFSVLNAYVLLDKTCDGKTSLLFGNIYKSMTCDKIISF